MADPPAQRVRLRAQLDTVRNDFARYQAQLANDVTGLEPEMVLVLEIAGSIQNFRQAIEAAQLEWLGELDIESAPDEEFYNVNKAGVAQQSDVKGRMYLSMANSAGMREMLALWKMWEEGKKLPNGKTKWRDVFSQLRKIRRWDIRESIGEGGMEDLWEVLTQPLKPDELVTFQIELFYRKHSLQRIKNVEAVNKLLVDLGGRLIGAPIDINQIAFHAVKACLPAGQIQRLLKQIQEGADKVDIALFKFSGIMYFRPTGQSLSDLDADEGHDGIAGQEGLIPLQEPVAALLDGAPMQLHRDLRGKLIVDDVFELEGMYQPGERKHGTSMASLIIHGDLSSKAASPIASPLYCVPIMQPDPRSRDRAEHMPDDVFFEDRIQIAVERMFGKAGGTAGTAPNIKVINLSIGDPLRPFIHEPSPWSRLIDWLSWKYRVLFCISAGNSEDGIDLELNQKQLLELDPLERSRVLIKAISKSLSSRRLLSPAEALNAITVGAAHYDESGDDFQPLRRIDIFSSPGYFNPASRLGHGFKRTVKPEIFLAGGRQLYRVPDLLGQTYFELDTSKAAPGQGVAWDSSILGKLDAHVHTRGSSNSSALATRAAVRIYEMLTRLRDVEGELIPETLMSVLMKALLVHGARQNEDVKKELTHALKTAKNGRQFKEILSRYMGYGIPNIDRVIECAENRATLLACDEIKQDEIHEYEFPLPLGLASQVHWRCLTVTLAWFSPINPRHRNLREAKLAFSAGGTSWEESQLKLSRCDADWQQAMRGTVQHEVLEGAKLIGAYQDGTVLRIQVECKKDATEYLDEKIPYALAVTLEVKDEIAVPIYQQIRAKIKPELRIGV